MNKEHDALGLSLLGSTGSIGIQTLSVAANIGARIDMMSAGSNDKLFEEQCRRFMPKIAAMADENAAKRLKVALADTDIKIYSGFSVSKLRLYKLHAIYKLTLGNKFPKHLVGCLTVHIYQSMTFLHGNKVILSLAGGIIGLFQIYGSAGGEQLTAAPCIFNVNGFSFAVYLD